MSRLQQARAVWQLCLRLDVGFVDQQEVRKFIRKHNITETNGSRPGKRPEFRVQLYYSGRRCRKSTDGS